MNSTTVGSSSLLLLAIPIQAQKLAYPGPVPGGYPSMDRITGCGLIALSILDPGAAPAYVDEKFISRSATALLRG